MYIPKDLPNGHKMPAHTERKVQCAPVIPAGTTGGTVTEDREESREGQLQRKVSGESLPGVRDHAGSTITGGKGRLQCRQR